MKNIEKYQNTQDALDAYSKLNTRESFVDWLGCEVEEPRSPSLLEAAEAITTTWFAEGSFELKMKMLCNLSAAIEREKRKPVRNFDKYNTADEAHVGFIEFCRKYTCGKCRFVNNGKPVGCAIKWLYGDASKDESK